MPIQRLVNFLVHWPLSSRYNEKEPRDAPKNKSIRPFDLFIARLNVRIPPRHFVETRDSEMHGTGDPAILPFPKESASCAVER